MMDGCMGNLLDWDRRQAYKQAHQVNVMLKSIPHSAVPLRYNAESGEMNYVEPCRIAEGSQETFRR